MKMSSFLDLTFDSGYRKWNIATRNPNQSTFCMPAIISLQCTNYHNLKCYYYKVKNQQQNHPTQQKNKQINHKVTFKT